MASHTEHHQEGMPDIPGYRLLRILGQGGMSTVYLGHQLSLADEFSPEVGHENSPLRFVSGFWPGWHGEDPETRSPMLPPWLEGATRWFDLGNWS